VKHELAHLHEEWLNGTLIVRIEGEIDASNVFVIGDRLRSLLTNRAIAMVLDLSATTYLDSAGLNLLFALAEEMRAHQQRFVLVVGEASPVRRVIDLTGVGVVAPMHASMDEAVSVICEPS
jgi:anti-anti-sigma factor